MARWQPDAAGRLQNAAVALFLERGYADVSVADIADRAGLTKRTFFNHFPDKREVLFAGAPAFQTSIENHLAEVEDDVRPLDAAVVALTRAGQELSVYRDVAHLRRDLIASSTELQERDLIKKALLTATVAHGLGRRGVPPPLAAVAAQAAMVVFTTAYDDWVEPGGTDLHAHMQRALVDLRQAVADSQGGPAPHQPPRPRPGRADV